MKRSEKNDRANRIVNKIMGKFKQLRQNEGLSHEALATKAGVSRPAISFIENGKRSPSLLVSIKIANALDQELSTLLHEIEQEEK